MMLIVSRGARRSSSLGIWICSAFPEALKTFSAGICHKQDGRDWLRCVLLQVSHSHEGLGMHAVAILLIPTPIRLLQSHSAVKLAPEKSRQLSDRIKFSSELLYISMLERKGPVNRLWPSDIIDNAGETRVGKWPVNELL